MAKDKIVEYDATANNNTVVGDVNLAENSMNPSDVNNALREILSHQKEAFGSGTPLYVDQANNRVGVNKTPTVALDVNGAVNVTGDITASSLNGGQLGGRRNLVINGAMQVAQRGTVTGVANNEYTLDRFAFTHSQDGAFTVTQDSSAPDGFGNSLKLDVTTADSSLSANQYLIMEHKIEAQNLQQLQFGKSGAKNVTLSFYVKSNKTGAYGVNIIQGDNSSKIANLTYTINSADTWEQKSLTFTGDTSGVINDDNGIGLKLGFTLAVGSTWTSGNTSASFRAFANGNYGGGHTVNILDNTSNEWYITGVQLEVGSQATPFEHASSFGEQLSLCERYFERWNSSGDNESLIAVGYVLNSGRVLANYKYNTPKRVDPTGTNSGASGFACLRGSWITATGFATLTNKHTARIDLSGLNGFTTGYAAEVRAEGGAGKWFAFDAEL